MLRRSTRSLFIARNRMLLWQSPRATSKGVTNPTVQCDDPAGVKPLEFGKNKNDSQMFQKAGGAWDTMRKVGGTNPIESKIERFEDQYQTEGTAWGAQAQQQTTSSPSLWERAKDAMQSLKESITPASKSDTTNDINLARNDDVTLTTTRTETTIGDNAIAEQSTVLSRERPSFADDATGHRPWDWEMAQHSMRNSTDGMGVIIAVGPKPAEYEARHPNQTYDNLNLQKEEVKQAWQNTKQAAKENWEDTKQAAKMNWQTTKGAARSAATEAKQSANQNYNQKVAEAKINLALNKEAAKENWRETKQDVQQSWSATKEATKERFREAGQQLKEGFSEVKEGIKSAGQAAKDATTSSNTGRNFMGTTRADSVEESYEELYNRPPGQGLRAQAGRLTEKELKKNTGKKESTTREDTQKGSSPEHGEKNAQVPTKNPTRYGDWEHGGRASDF